MSFYCVQTIISLGSSVLFILALKSFSSAKTSSVGNFWGIVGMLMAMFCGHYWDLFILGQPDKFCTVMIIFAFMSLGGAVGYYVAKNVSMTALPQLLAAFHSLVGLAAIFVASNFFIYTMHYIKHVNPSTYLIVESVHYGTPRAHFIENILGAVIGAITFTGSIVAFGKLQGLIVGKPWRFKGQGYVNFVTGLCLVTLMVAFIVNQSMELFIASILFALAIGVLLIMPIGGADMPVIISMLNSYSGWATAGIGFSTNSELLVIVGALVGTSGAILSHIMCKGMNRSLLNVIFGGFGSKSSGEATEQNSKHGNVKLCSPDDAGFILKNANSVIIVPGYGMAVAQAQHVIKELADELKSEDITVKYAIHPVAGRMPGHMNVLLAEANIPYEDVFELDDINHEFGTTDVVVVIGANDITNPAAKNDPNSPIYGMPVLDVEKARTVLFVKRSLGSGYAGIENQLFYRDNTMMVLGDAKKVCENILKAMKG